MQTKLREEIEREDATLVNQLVPVSKDKDSEPLTPVSIVQVSANGGDPDEIFLNAIAEIDTQPLIKPKREGTLTIGEILEVCLLVSVLCFSFMGIVWQCITYPHTLVILFASEKPAQITTTLDLPTRPLAAITVTRSQTVQTTGHGHLDETQAAGVLTFYNASFSSQTIQAGSVFTSANGIQILTNETVTVPANNPPQDGIASVASHTQTTGSIGNIQAFAINGQVSSSLYVKNLSAFTGGRNARDFQAVAQRDLDSLTTSTTQTVNQAVPPAFILQVGEAVHVTNCTTKASADHAAGAEAQTVTVTTSATCQGIAYSRVKLSKEATAAFTQTRPEVNYHIVGSAQTTLQTVTPFVVTIHGTWIYTFSTAYEQHLAEQIQGDSPDKARASLLKTGVIAQASIPSTLPPAEYINFLVLAG